MTTYYTAAGFRYVGTADDPECQLGPGRRYHVIAAYEALGPKRTRGGIAGWAPSWSSQQPPTPCGGPLGFYLNDEPDPPVQGAMCGNHFAQLEAETPTFARSRRRLPSALTREGKGSIWRLLPDAVVLEHGIGNH